MVLKYEVSGVAHGSYVQEFFDTLGEATDYASRFIDGDVDSTVELLRVALPQVPDPAPHVGTVAFRIVGERAD
jgi:hypothetical protein